MTHQISNMSLQLDGNEYSANFLRDHALSMSADPGHPGWKRNIFSFLHDWFSDSDHILQPTSGTTGKKKKVKLAKSAMIRSAENTLAYFDLTKDQKALLVLPVDYIAGKMMIVRAMISGLSLYTEEPKAHLELDKGDRYAFAAMVPMQVYHLIMKDSLPRIDKLIIGGAEISAELMSMLLKESNKIYATYGMAETASHIAIRCLNRECGQGNFEVLPGIRVSTDERDCLVIETDYLEEKVITNDVIDLYDDGSFVWKGRFDNQINSGGLKLHPEEAENLILEQTGVPVVILGLPDEKLGQQVVLVISDMPASLDSLMKALSEIIPSQLMPKQVVNLKRAFPRTESFKIDRLKLKKDVQTKMGE